MHVYCTDGTVFDCARYEVNEYGLVLYGQEQPESRDRYDDVDDTQIGFVPHDRLWYVLPRGVTPQAGLAQQGGQPTRGPAAGPRQQPPGDPADQGRQPHVESAGNGPQNRG